MIESESKEEDKTSFSEVGGREGGSLVQGQGGGGKEAEGREGEGVEGRNGFKGMIQNYIHGGATSMVICRRLGRGEVFKDE